MGNIIGQVLTLISYIIFYWSRFLKSKNALLISEIIIKIICIVAFIFLGSASGIINSIFGIVRNTTGIFVKNKNIKIKHISLVLLLLLLTIIQFTQYEGINTIFVYVCAVINALGIIVLKEQGQRITGAIGGTFYFLFQIAITNWVGAICELGTIISQLTSWFKYRKGIYNND